METIFSVLVTVSVALGPSSTHLYYKGQDVNVQHLAAYHGAIVCQQKARYGVCSVHLLQNGAITQTRHYIGNAIVVCAGSEACQSVSNDQAVRRRWGRNVR